MPSLGLGLFVRPAHFASGHGARQLQPNLAPSKTAAARRQLLSSPCTVVSSLGRDFSEESKDLQQSKEFLQSTEFGYDRPLARRSQRKKPIRIILVRHGESEGNVDECVYMRKPDNKISLTEKGKEQARQTGRQIRDLVGDGNVYFYMSPYRRAKETLYEIGKQLPKGCILGVREDARLREQDFGNFQDEQMSVFKKTRNRFSRFFFRFRDGESAADVYDRVTTFRETLRNDVNFGRFKEKPTTVVIVTHGLTLRVFLMRWYKWTVDMFEKVYNPRNACTMVMSLCPGGRYSLMVHHSEEELRGMGFTGAMVNDQLWQMSSPAAGYNPEWPTSGYSFFEEFEKKMAAEDASSDSVDLFEECPAIPSGEMNGSAARNRLERH